MAEILVVDDVADAGMEYARLIEGATRLGVVVATNQLEALNLLKDHPIKVAVLDQRIGAEKGTDVFAEMIKVDAGIRGVMFSGEAAPEEVGSALRLGYVSYLSKAEVAKLAQTVGEQLHAYNLSLAKITVSNDKQRFFRVKHGVWPMRQRVDFFLVKIQKDARVGADLEWSTVETISAGEKRTSSVTVSVSNTVSFERETTHALVSELGLKSSAIQALSGKVSAQLRERVVTTGQSAHSRTVVVERSYELPPEPVDPNQLHVISRRFERAQVVVDFRLSVVSVCSCCNARDFRLINGSMTDSKYVTRQVDTYSTGEVREVETGPEAMVPA